jgi:hypothetical protein
MTAREKANAGLWLLKQAVVDLLKDPRHREGIKTAQVREALGLKSQENEAPGVAYALLRLMADDGDIAKTGGYDPSFFLPVNER